MEKKIPEKFKKYLSKKSLIDLENEGKVKLTKTPSADSFSGMDILPASLNELEFYAVEMAKDKKSLKLKGKTVQGIESGSRVFF